MSTAIDQSAVARAVGIKTAFKDLRNNAALFLPMRIAVIGQGSTSAQATYSNDKAQVFSAQEVGETYGYGSPLHLICKQLLPANGDGVGTIPVTVYPLDDHPSGVAATGTITPGGSQTVAANYQVKVSNILSEVFTINAGDSVATITAAITAAINGAIDMPCTAVDGTTVVNLTSKWEGESANDLVIEIVGSTTAGTTFGLVQFASGATDPDIQSALDQFGDVWETLVLNAFQSTATTPLNALQTFNEGRWLPTVRKPFISFTGTNEASVTTAIAVPDARPTDRTNVQLVSPGSNDLPFVISSRQLARIAVIANNNPPRDYGSQQATGLVPGADSDQWSYAERDTAVKGGSSTVEIKDGIVNLSDTVTYYHKTGEVPPAYRYVCDIIKSMTILYNLELAFNNPEWDGAPLIPDNQPTSNPTAKKPKMAKAVVASLIDSLALNAIISDPDTAKETIIAEINDQNPKRLDITFTVQLSGNTNIISIDFNFGFYFGTATIVA